MNALRFIAPRASTAVGVACVVAVLCGASAAHAQSAPTAGTTAVNRYSAYERAALAAALRQYRTVVDRSPDGKILEGVDIVTLDVLEPLSWEWLPVMRSIPTFVDMFHTTSKHYVIAREVLLVPGERYRQSLVDDSVRNLRGLPQLSMVLATATAGSAPDRVRLLVITKDVWSLRPNWNLQLANGGIFMLSAQPAETNLAGTQTTANLNFVLNPAQITFGAGYTNYRLDGTRIQINPTANVVWSRDTGSAQGTFGGLVAGQPLYSPTTKWAWDASVNWTDFVYYRFSNATVASYDDATTHQALPFAFRGQLYDTQYTLTRSFGWSTKHDFTVGASLAISQYGVDPGTECTEYSAPLARTVVVPCSARTVGDFVSAFVPVSDNRVGPFLQWHTYRKRYVRLLDFETLGLQEDYRLGPEAFLNLYPVAQAFGSSRNFMGVDGSVLYTLPVKDGLVRASVESITEAQADGLPDASIDAFLHVVSPTALFGRFVWDTHVLDRYRNYMNQVSYLGGDTRLRGYPTQFFAGKDIVVSNLEFRTRSLDIWTAQTGLVAFYDEGDAFNAFAEMRPYASVGFGARALFPQLDRLVARFDVGFPVADGARLPGVTPVGFFFAIGQAFGVPAIGPGGGPGSPQLTGSPTTAIGPPP